MARVLSELFRRQGVGLGERAGLVRERTFSREGIVQPLCKKPAMQWNHTTIGVCNNVQLVCQTASELKRIIHTRRCEVAENPQQFLRISHGASNTFLDLAQKTLAFVLTTDEVVRGRHDAIASRQEVVWDDDLLAKPR